MHRACWAGMDDLQSATIADDDATSGQSILARVMARKTELEALLDGLPEHDLGTQGEIYLELATIHDLLSGDLDNLPSEVIVDMNRWLERNKDLVERHES